MCPEVRKSCKMLNVRIVYSGELRPKCLNVIGQLSSGQLPGGSNPRITSRPPGQPPPPTHTHYSVGRYYLQSFTDYKIVFHRFHSTQCT